LGIRTKYRLLVGIVKGRPLAGMPLGVLPGPDTPHQGGTEAPRCLAPSQRLCPDASDNLHTCHSEPQRRISLPTDRLANGFFAAAQIDKSRGPAGERLAAQASSGGATLAKQRTAPARQTSGARAARAAHRQAAAIAAGLLEMRLLLKGAFARSGALHAWHGRRTGAPLADFCTGSWLHRAWLTPLFALREDQDRLVRRGSGHARHALGDP